MSPAAGARRPDRSLLVRRLSRLGHARLRRGMARVRAGGAPATLVAPAVRWLARGELTVPSGRAQGLRLSLEGLPPDHAHLGAIAYGLLETAVQEALVRHLPRGGTLVDVGANVGFFTLLGARLVGPDGRVAALEPAPVSAAAIRRNAARNGFGHVEVLQCAAGAASGRAAFQIVRDESWSKLEPLGAHPDTERVVDVKVAAIDDLVADGRLPVPDVVKIDVEGAELDVLRGMARTAAARPVAIVCELHGTGPEFAALMAQWGYRAVNLEGPEPVTEAGPSGHALGVRE